MAKTSSKQQYAKKGSRKTRHRSFFCLSSWLGCCGGSVSSRVSADGKFARYGTRDQLRGKKIRAVINPSSSTDEILFMSREIHVVDEGGDAQGKTRIPDHSHVVNNKQGKISDKDNQEMSKSDPLLNSKTLTDSPNRLVQQGSSTPKTSKKKGIKPHSASMPVLPLPPSLPSPPRKNDNKPKNGNQMMDDGSELDSNVGVVILTVTLIVMLICGKVCAILCTAAWLYYIPRLRSNVVDVRAKDDEVNFDSQEYKDRVVLQGLLQRN